MRFDEQMDALAHVERRRLLVALFREGSGEERPEGNAVLDVPEWAADGTTTVSLVALRHKHLPKLEDLGLVRWDRERDLVTEGPQFGEIEPLLALLDENGAKLPDDWL